MTKHFDVFLSYSSQDEAVARTLYEQLQAHGLTCWWAGNHESIPAGEDYRNAIIRGLGTSRSMVLLLSLAANRSPHVSREINLADDQRIPILPILIQAVPHAERSPQIEYLLAGCQFYDVFSGKIEDHIDQILRAIRYHIGHPPAPTRSTPTDRPIHPIQTGPENVGGQTGWPEIAAYRFTEMVKNGSIGTLLQSPWR